MKNIFLLKKLVLSTLLLCTLMIAKGQNVDIRFHRDSVNCDLKSACYTTQIRPNGTMPINLAGQNYRIFYNSSRAKTTTITSLLPIQYGAISIVQDLTDIDASSSGAPLSFKSTLGFLNYSIDLSDVQFGGIEIPMNEWYSTSRICFEIDQAVFDDADKCLETVWGREGLTDSLASAFVQVSRWVSTNKTTYSIVVEYYDLDSSIDDNACFADICDEDSNYEIMIDDVLVNESIGQVTVQICLDKAATKDVTVSVKTSNGSALAGEDYVAITDTIVTIPAGQICVPLLISILDDDIHEGNETFNVELSNPSSNVVIINQTGVVTIQDDEVIPSLSISDLIVLENADIIYVPVTLSGKSNQNTTFTVNTNNITALGGVDYNIIVDQFITILAGETSKNIPITIIDDLIVESSKTFEIVLSDISSNAIISDNTGIVTIIDNDESCDARAPKLSKK